MKTLSAKDQRELLALFDRAKKILTATPTRGKKRRKKWTHMGIEAGRPDAPIDPDRKRRIEEVMNRLWRERKRVRA